MEITTEAYCRFCAERKHADKMLNLNNDPENYEKALKQLKYLNANFVDVSEQNVLPKTVCFICFDTLNKAYEFLITLKKAQTVLNFVFSVSETCPEVKPSEPHTTSNATVKDEQNSAELSNKSKLETAVKLEWVDEDDDDDTQPLSYYKEDVEGLQPISFLKDDDVSNTLSDESFGVHNILEVAINKPELKGLEFFAKELNKVKGKNIKQWEQYRWTCVYCTVDFSTIDALRQHAKDNHKKCYAFCCMDCVDITFFKSVFAFANHVRKHNKYLRKVCFFCDIKHEDINTHLQEHTNTNHCELCGESFDSLEQFQTHVREYTTEKPKKIRRKRGEPITTQELTCKTCKKVYKNLNSLRDHQKLHQADRKKNHICELCGKTFFSKGSLTSHIMSSHDKIKPHICKICKKTFAFPNMLRRHVEVHTGAKPFSCETCGKCFRLSYQLNIHKIVHTDNMPYICQYCSKAFRFKQILKNHERIHTGAKPYNCSNCTMEFSNWSNYNKHMKRKHGTDTAKKKITPEGSFPIDPNTGDLIGVNDPINEEWKNKIMIPGKRGRKKVIKE